jgi:hypothetical protein
MLGGLGCYIFGFSVCYLSFGLCSGLRCWYRFIRLSFGKVACSLSLGTRGDVDPLRVISIVIQLDP